MSLTLAQRSQLRKRAAQEASAAEPSISMTGATAYEMQLAQLAQDRARLKQIQSAQGKAELKRQLLPAYQPYVDGVLASGRGAQDEVLTTLMIWRLDAGDYPGALAIGRYVLEHKMVMPDRFARTTGCLFAEEIAIAALGALRVGSDFSFEVLEEAEQLTRDEDMPDEARAKLHLALGRLLAKVPDGEPCAESLAMLTKARTHLARAIELHSSSGGKKDLERVERLLKKHAGPAG